MAQRLEHTVLQTTGCGFESGLCLCLWDWFPPKDTNWSYIPGLTDTMAQLYIVYQMFLLTWATQRRYTVKFQYQIYVKYMLDKPEEERKNSAFNTGRVKP